jgi:hypothetical protein
MFFGLESTTGFRRFDFFGLERNTRFRRSSLVITGAS